MTVEIGILNNNCVVLAADSAATINNKKVYNSSNKIFQLSKYEPVGIMTYSNASIMNVPVEQVVKMYRDNLGKKSQNSLKEYCNDFIDYISCLLTNNQQINQVWYLQQCLVTIFNDYDSIPELISTADKFDKISKNYAKNDRMDFKYENINLKYRQDIINFCINKIDCNEHNIDELIKCIVALLNSNSFCNYTGIAISGYGKQDLFPQLYHFWIDGIIDDKLKYTYLNDEVLINNNQLQATIKYFAQYDDIYTVVNGINLKFKNIISDNINNTFISLPGIIKAVFKDNNIGLSDEQMKMLNKVCCDINSAFCKSIEDFREFEMSGPMMDAISLMSKEDLAELAEALLKIATIKRKASFDLETVGGPIDVAVITKGDGFVWINRKLYFDKNLNYNFFNKNGGGEYVCNNNGKEEH